jgi:hypothetical protein
MAEATAEAEKQAWRCEALASLLAEVKDRLQQARAAEAERAREAAAVEAAAAAAAVEAEAAAAEAAAAEAAAAAASERLQMEEEAAALSLRVQADTLRLQQMQAQLGVAPAPCTAEEAQCVVCMDAPKDHIVLPCMHMCACEACAQHLLKRWPPRCPVCRGAIERIGQVFT